MAWIQYVDRESIPAEHRIDDDDNVLRIHSVHSRVIKQHYELYAELMHGPGPLTREQREMIGVAVSHVNQCHY